MFPNRKTGRSERGRSSTVAPHWPTAERNLLSTSLALAGPNSPHQTFPDPSQQPGPERHVGTAWRTRAQGSSPRGEDGQDTEGSAEGNSWPQLQAKAGHQGPSPQGWARPDTSASPPLPAPGSNSSHHHLSWAPEAMTGCSCCPARVAQRRHKCSQLRAAGVEQAARGGRRAMSFENRAHLQNIWGGQPQACHTVALTLKSLSTLPERTSPAWGLPPAGHTQVALGHFLPLSGPQCPQPL